MQLFQILKQKLGEKEAEALVGFVDSKLKENNENNLRILSTKEDISNVREELGGLRADVTSKISETKAEIIKWMFIFWLGSVGVLLGNSFCMLNAYLK